MQMYRNKYIEREFGYGDTRIIGALSNTASNFILKGQNEKSESLNAIYILYSSKKPNFIIFYTLFLIKTFILFIKNRAILFVNVFNNKLKSKRVFKLFLLINYK